MGYGGGMCELFADDDCEFGWHASDADDLFSILQTWEECIKGGAGGGGGGGGGAAVAAFTPGSVVVGGAEVGAAVAATARPTASARRREREGDDQEKVGEGGGGGAPVRKKHKGSPSASAAAAVADDEGAAKMSHITVERNRRKQMNENLAVLRTLMPCFYVKRGDQASIIGGVVDYIKELQQVLHSLEAKKHRKVYAEHVLSPRPPPPPSPSPLVIKSAVPPLSPRLAVPPLSPRLAVPISPRTPTPGSPYKPYAGGGGGGAARLPHPATAAYISPAMTPTSLSSQSQPHTAHDLSPRPYLHLPTLDSIVTELAARPAVAGGVGLLLLPDVKVEFAGPNLVLKTMSQRAPGQVLRIIAALESLSLEILHVTISNVDDTMVHSFTIKIGIECELSAEELVHEIRQAFL